MSGMMFLFVVPTIMFKRNPNDSSMHWVIKVGQIRPCACVYMLQSVERSMRYIATSHIPYSK